VTDTERLDMLQGEINRLRADLVALAARVETVAHLAQQKAPKLELRKGTPFFG
jgi:hypothetical protein